MCVKDVFVTIDYCLFCSIPALAQSNSSRRLWNGIKAGLWDREGPKILLLLPQDRGMPIRRQVLTSAPSAELWLHLANPRHVQQSGVQGAGAE